MPKKVRREQLTPSILALPFDEQQSVLKEAGLEIDDSPAAQPQQITPEDAMAWEGGGAMPAPIRANPQMVKAYQEGTNAPSNFAVGALTGAAGSMASGVPLPMAAGMGLAQGAANVFGPDIASGRGLANAASNLLPLGKIPMAFKPAAAQFVQRALQNTGQITGTQALGDLFSGAMGERAKDAPSSVSPVQGGILGAATAALPAGAQAFLNKIATLPPAIREKMMGMLPQVLKQQMAPDELAQQYGQLNQSLARGPQLVPKPTIPNTTASPPATVPAPKALDYRLVSEGRPSRAFINLTPENEPELVQKAISFGMASGGALDQAAVQKATNLNKNDAGILLNKMRAGKSAQPAAPPAPTPQAATDDNLESLLEQSLAQLGKPPVTAKAPPVAPPSVEPPPAPAVSFDAARTLADLKEQGPERYFAKVLDDAKEFKTLPQVLKHLGEAFPDENFRPLVRGEIVKRVISGIGDEGPIGDLSILQRIKGLDKEGAAAIRSVFGEGDNATNAYHNLITLQEFAEKVAEKPKGGFFDELKLDPGGTMFRLVLKSLPSAAAGGAAYTGMAHGNLMLDAAITGAAGAIPPIAGRVLNIRPERIAELIASNGKALDVLKALAEGHADRFSIGTINQVLGALRRRADSEELQTEQDASRRWEEDLKRIQ